MNERWNQIGFSTLLGRECHRFLRLFNQTLIPPLVTATLYILIFGYSLGSRIEQVGEVSYMHFLIPGLVMMGVISSAYANTSSSLYIARFQGNIQELLVSSLSSLEIVLAIILGGVLRGMLVGALIMAVATTLTGIGIAHPLLVLFFIGKVAVVFSCAGFLAALWAENFDRLSLFQNYILTPLTYLGGVFFSVDMLPPFWREVAMANPILYFINGLRYGFLEISDVNPLLSFASVIVIALVLFTTCWRLFHLGYNIKT